ncbi:MAG: hypothetical protein SOZ66_07530 [Candidatus Cryptobacteroides sp.]|nr:hypothetical protein [Candidatus Cryptobacteroides sp.]
MIRPKATSALLSILLLASCQEKIDAPGTNPPEEETKLPPVSLNLTSSVSTRTVLGEESGGRYPVYWSDGDRICVNGVKSSTSYGLGPGCTDAEFVVEGVTAPYHIVYPSIICSGMDPEGVASIEIPMAQAYVPGSFASGSAILYGSTSEKDAELENLCGVVRIPLLKGSAFGSPIGSITLASKSPEAPLCGEFRLDTRSGSLTPVVGNASVLLSLPSEGIVLDETEPSYFYLAIPGGKYPEGFTLTLSSPEGNMLCDWVGETEVPSGIMVTLDPIGFKPDNTKLIDGIDSWNEFAADVNAGTYERWLNPDTQEANIVADISYGGDLTTIAELPAGFILNGGGHTIKRANACEPLIVLIAEGATVKNLTLGGNRIGRSSSASDDRGTGNLAAFNRGTVENCTNDMAITLSGVDNQLKIAGLVSDNAGVIKDSKNLADINIFLSISANRLVSGGGISAVAHRNLGSDKYSGDFINCENRGNITVSRAATGSFSLVRFSLGGIVGCIDQGTSEEFTRISGCSNSGNLTYYQDSRHTNANYGYAVGGIVGRSCLAATGPDYYYYIGGANASSYDGYYVEIEDCINTGTIDASIYSATVGFQQSGARQPYIGGLVGMIQSPWDNHSKVSGCVVDCDIRTGNTVSADCTGGLFGGIGYVDVENCRATVDFSLSKNNLTTATSIGFVGGVAGFIARDSSFKDCSATISFTQGSAQKVSGVGFVGCVGKHPNLNANLLSPGCATLTLEGTNVFSGTIKDEPVSADNVAPSGNLGIILGSITIK